MTLTDARDTRDIPRDISDADARALARAEWHESGGTLTGKVLAERFGRSPRWGQDQASAARREANGTPVAAAVTPRREERPAAATPRVPRPAAKGPARSRPAARPARPPVPLQVVTGLAVALVTIVCAVVSYSHIAALARTAGMGSLAGWLPLALDGMVAAATCSLIVDRRSGTAGHPLAWAGVIIGLAGSLAANVMAVDPELVPLRAVRWVLAGYPPVTLAVVGHLAARMLGDRP